MQTDHNKKELRTIGLELIVRIVFDSAYFCGNSGFLRFSISAGYTGFRTVRCGCSTACPFGDILPGILSGVGIVAEVYIFDDILFARIAAECDDKFAADVTEPEFVADSLDAVIGIFARIAVCGIAEC